MARVAMTGAVRFAVLAMALAAMALLAACGSARRGEPIIGPLALDSHLQQGRKVFDEHCYKCHTQGEGGMGPIINDKPLPRFLMRTQVRVGLGTMPSFSRQQISDEELDALLDYMVALRRAGG
jgi:mono/diheme cytochrome c family protein